MFVPVVAYDPDLFADYVFVLSQMEISTDSQPVKRSASETQSSNPNQRVTDGQILSIALYKWSQILKQQVSSTDIVSILANGASQVQSKFTPRTFTSNLAAPRSDAPLVSGQFVTEQSIEVLFDNLVFRVSVPALDLSDTKANNKSVAPVVS